MYAISPDGHEVAYTSNIDEVEATSTNNEIFIVPMTGGAPKKISTSPGSDSTPVYSWHGEYLAWRSQARAGFEADKWQLFVLDRRSGQTQDVTEKFDRSVGSFTWMSPLDVIAFAAEDHGEAPIYTAHITLADDGKRLGAGQIFPGPKVHADDLAFTPNNVFFIRASIAAPNEIWKWTLASEQKSEESVGAITDMNDALLSQFDMQP